MFQEILLFLLFFSIVLSFSIFDLKGFYLSPGNNAIIDLENLREPVPMVACDLNQEGKAYRPLHTCRNMIQESEPHISPWKCSSSVVREVRRPL
jgi:hypothetical protein